MPVERTDFSKLSANTSRLLLNKGGVSKIDFIPRILNEHMSSAEAIQSTITSTNHVGQVFKASKDNISALMLTLESAAGIVVDNFESYANSTALQVEWVASGNLATLEETIVTEGTKAMSLPGDALADSWTNTIASTDYTDYVGSFEALFDDTFNKFKVSVFIGDGTNTKSFQIAHTVTNLFIHYDINEQAMSEDGGGTTDVTAITQIGFRIDDRSAGKVCIIDDVLSTPPPGSVIVKLWDMGDTIPVSGTTSIDDGTQYTTIGPALTSSITLDLIGGRRVYHLPTFLAGTNKKLAANQILNIGNYYILEIEYVDTNVNVYGTDSTKNTNLYKNGFAFTTPNDSTPITAINTYSDIMFGIFSTQDILLANVSWRFDAAPGTSASIHVFVNDSGYVITEAIVDHEVQPEQEFTTDLSDRLALVQDGGGLEFLYNDDFTDSVTYIIGEARFYYKPPIVNG